MHSWTLEEFLEAFMEEEDELEAEAALFKENREIFAKEWPVNKRGSDGVWKVSASEIVTQKYFTMGGSARWMLGSTTAETEQASDPY
ncbi:expressed unknown protein [Seminavis robusta]|uniref:Uncharacterized protein n=1 Tax=Seminavis robusta TaxID=568900 RepID=A0A9N8HQI5_9STRA|nr:expressed unknown protein [Seminavis robusta]|eukprot:Sro1446_g273470.1 n/a (87) ;mRNA; r:19144-19404